MIDRTVSGWEPRLWGWRGGEAAAELAAAARVARLVDRLSKTGMASQEGPAGKGYAGPVSGRIASLLQPPASPDALADTELRLGVTLPADYACFLIHADGATLTDTGDPGRRMMELLGTTALVRCAEETERLGRAACGPELLIFAAVGSNGDQLAFETARRNPCGGCAVLDAQPDDQSDRWWVIARDFGEWLERVLTDPGPPGSFGRHWEPTVIQPSLPLPDLSSGEPSDRGL